MKSPQLHIKNSWIHTRTNRFERTKDEFDRKKRQENQKIVWEEIKSSSFCGISHNCDEGQVAVSAGGIEAVADDELVRDNKAAIIDL